MSDVSATANPYQCSGCQAPIPSNVTWHHCQKCGVPIDTSVVSKGRAEANKQKVEQGEDVKGSAELCIFLGLGALAVGIYFLVFNADGGLSSSFINAHAVTIGQTATICGTILLGLGIRPR